MTAIAINGPSPSAAQCQKCPHGSTTYKFQEYLGDLSVCQVCQVDYFMTEAASSSPPKAATCVPCPNGSSITMVTDSINNESICKECQIGYYLIQKADPANKLAAKCIKCPLISQCDKNYDKDTFSWCIELFTPKNLPYQPSQCQLCPKNSGTLILQSIYQSQQQYCQLCQSGFYLQQSSKDTTSAFCVQCPIGTTPSSIQTEIQNISQCDTCLEGYYLTSPADQGAQPKAAQCTRLQFVDYKSKIFTEEKVEQIQQQSKQTSQVVSYSSIAMSQIQNMGSNSSFAIVLSVLTIQKLTYILLIKKILPKQIYLSLQEFSGQLPSQQFQFMNIFKLILEQDYHNYQDINYEEVGLPYHILNNCGQSIVLFFICLLILIIFYYLIEKKTNQKLKNISTKVYQYVFSAYVIQYLQIIIGICNIGVNQQAKEFIYNEAVQNKGIKITFLIFCFILAITIFWQLYKQLNILQSSEKIMSFQEITRQKILNEVIEECAWRRNFTLIYIFFEIILIPIIFISINQSWKIAIITSIVIQAVFLLVIIKLRPFSSLCTNIFFIINSLLWLFLYVQYYLISHFSDKDDINNYSNILDYISLSFLITVQIILLIQPAYMLVVILIQIYLALTNKNKERKKQKEKSQFNYNNQTLKQLIEENIASFQKVSQIQLQDLSLKSNKYFSYNQKKYKH
ncbi:hypothetical protein ABPG74_012116 [Tetrahymena malaccensis]